MRTVVHEPHGTVELMESAALDLMVVNAARVSHGNFTTEMREEDERLIGYLMREKHGTPFEHNVFIFHVKAPIFVFREWHRHRIGVSINEMSGRYTQLRPEFYIPEPSHVRRQIGKPGHYTYETADAPFADEVRNVLNKSYNKAYEKYEGLLKDGVAKEIARLCLPVATYSEMFWTCNARSLMSFLELRCAPNAQREIQDYAHAMLEMFLEKMPVTAREFINSGCKAP